MTKAELETKQKVAYEKVHGKAQVKKRDPFAKRNNSVLPNPAPRKHFCDNCRNHDVILKKTSSRTKLKHPTKSKMSFDF